jgi:hypothetical protein
MEENPSTGCDGSGKLIPFVVVPAKKVPAGGPGAYVATGRTARPSKVGCGRRASSA